MKTYRYISENTTAHLSLHDCVCSRCYSDGSDLIFDMQWLEVFSSHPHNPTDKARQSGEGRIVLHGARITHGALISDDTEQPVCDTIDVQNAEILDFDETTDAGEYIYNIFAVFHKPHPFDFIKLTVRCTSSTVMFDELNDPSWFEAECFTSH